MNTTLWTAAAALVLLPGSSLTTDYGRDRSLRIEAQTQMRMESTTKFERQGEPGEFHSTSEQKRSVVQVDHVLAHDGSTPTKVRRHFVELKNSMSATMGDRDFNDDREGALVDVTLDLTRDGDDVKVEVVDGHKPDGDALDGHRLELALDALLPEKDVKAGDEWSPDSDAVKRALGLDLSSKLFPPPPPDSSGGGQGGGGGGGRGRGRGFGGGMAGSLLQHADWECKAKLKEGDEEYEGASCAVIELTITAKGSVPESEGGGGHMLAAPALENSFEIELEGTLLFDKSAHMPAHLSLNGKVETESHTERTFGDNKMKMDSESKGELVYEVSVKSEKSE